MLLSLEVSTLVKSQVSGIGLEIYTLSVFMSTRHMFLALND